MASKSINIYAPASSKYPYVLGVSFTETTDTTLTANNQTYVTPIASLMGKYIRFDGTGGTLAVYWYDDNKHVNGTLVASVTVATTSNGVTYTASNTIAVEHKADGTLNGYAKAVWTKTASNSYVPPTSNVSTDSTPLTSLPRDTKLANQSGVIGDVMNIAWTKASAGFTHKLTYTFGDVTETIGTDLVDSVAWTPPEKLYKELEKGPGSMTLTTYSGSTRIGTPQTATLTLSAKKEVAEPVIQSMSVEDVNDTTKALTGNNKVLVFFKSEPSTKFVFDTREYATASKIYLNNVEFPVPEGVLQKDGKTTRYTFQVHFGTTTTNNFTISVTDSRNFTVSDMLIADFVEYIPLSISSTFKRISPTTGQVGLKFDGTVFSGSFGKQSNSLSISYSYKKQNDSVYSDPITLVQNTDFKISGKKFFSGSGTSAEVIELLPVFDYKSVYNVQLYVSDKLTTLPIINAVIVKGIPIFWWNGEKVVINGDLYVADTDGNNQLNIKSLIGQTGDTLPIGAMLPYGNANPPTNWLVCDGSEVSRERYADLFAVIGTSYGEGDGSTTFNLPDKRGRVSVGYDSTQEMFNTVGAKVGSNTHTLTIDEMPSHSHAYKALYGETYEASSVLSWNLNQTNWNWYATSSTGGGKAHSILQASEVDNWIIKAYQSAGVLANTSQEVNDSTNDVPSCKAVKDYIAKTGGGGGGTTDYEYLSNLPKINGQTLVGNKTASALGLQPAGTYATLDDLDEKQDTLVSGTTIKTVNNMSLLGSGNVNIAVPTKTSQLTNDSGFLTSHQDLSNYATKEDVTTQITNAIGSALGGSY